MSPPDVLTIASELGLLLPVALLLPAMAILIVRQSDPVQALVMRGLLGAIASLLYACLGAPDVALTEALVGSLLSTTLYAVTLRSSMAIRIERAGATLSLEQRQTLDQWLAGLHIRLELLEPCDAHEECQPAHGLLHDNGRLVLRNARLVQRLEELDGSRRWRALGGSLEAAVPTPAAMEQP
ncbi:DUF4040 domain-containing protein [Synechococcus sp. RSCCF101]|uniref:hydrogenase subunit MbhD domain-containing protein n=1 Tax=Synechococcus sp. RSCCF101 TaxID=2511069 RepID=UPI00124716D0|nr:hydrogenase subunit MbhD domain-containing protein [Synechococcus sp. RSCCF101]QEY31181.1 DUF4040 domain-containing protein [Synechococcus sp. RSCCF101]